MPIKIVWDNDDHTIIRKVFTERWTWHDYGEALQTSHTMMAEHAHSIGIILDLSASNHVPANPLPALRERLAEGMPENWAGTAVVNGSFFVQSLAKIVNQGVGTVAQKVIIAASLNEARKRLAERQQEADRD